MVGCDRVYLVHCTSLRWRKKTKYLERTCVSIAYSTTNPTITWPGDNTETKFIEICSEDVDWRWNCGFHESQESPGRPSVSKWYPVILSYLIGWQDLSSTAHVHPALCKKACSDSSMALSCSSIMLHRLLIIMHAFIEDLKFSWR
jgi:hypothetical protein